jgi:cytochrome P450
MHSLAARFALVADEEMGEVCERAVAGGKLDWDAFFVGWYRMVRRIVLGDAARDDEELTDLLAKLRHRANLAFLWPKDRSGREAFLARVRGYVDAAAPGSLAGQMARACTDATQQPHHQLPHYLFAFDPAGMASFRTLALLAAHPEVEARVLAEIAAARGQGAPALEVVRACVLESLRLWPTTPAILRETTRRVQWGHGNLEAGTQVLIYAPFFHRDDETLEHAHGFDPMPWVGKVVRPELGFVPFSHGDVVCPAARFVPMVAAFALRSVLARCALRLEDAERVPPGRLPGTLDPYTLRFSVAEAGR